MATGFTVMTSEQLMEYLTKSIMRGDADLGRSIALLDRLTRTGQTRQLLIHREGKDQSVLHLAVKFSQDPALVCRLLQLCPQLLLVTRSDEYEGQTALHIAISKGNLEAAKAMLSKRLQFDSSERSLLLHLWARGRRFQYTVMMGELPLSVAALSVNSAMVELLLKKGAKMAAQNSRGDTVFHSLIRFAHLYPDKTQDMLAMGKFLQEWMVRRQQKLDETVGELQMDSTDPLAIWFLTNKQGLTPLQLAAQLGVVEMFQFILNLDNVYCSLDEHDGLFDIHLYDVTEIDNVALRLYSAKPRPHKPSKAPAPPVNYGGLKPTPEVRTEDCWTTAESGSERPATQQSVLDSVCLVDITRAFALINTPVIKHIIKQKWARYQIIYYVWGVLHLLYMVLLTTSAEVKTRVIMAATGDVTVDGNSTDSSGAQPLPSVSRTEENFVIAMVIVNILVAALIVTREVVYYFVQKKRWHLCQVHHNGLYRLILLLLALSLLVDSVWFLVRRDNNYGVIAALLLGWWFLTFFLRAFLKFSFFTVMLQKVLLGDMTRFAAIIGIVLISFSVAMYITFQETWPPVPEMDGYPTTLLLMFKLMLGLADIEVLSRAQHPWVAVTLFVAFVLLTYLLMLNALIAMMSQTCALVSENRYLQWELQRLSVILYIEAMLPQCLQRQCGQPKKIRVFDIQRNQVWEQERYFCETMSLQTSVADGNAIIRRRALMQTLGFEDPLMHYHPRHLGTHSPSPFRPPTVEPPDPIANQEPSFSSSPGVRRRRSSRRRKQQQQAGGEDAVDGGEGAAEVAAGGDRRRAAGREAADTEESARSRPDRGDAQHQTARDNQPARGDQTDRARLPRRPSGRVGPASGPDLDPPRSVQLLQEPTLAAPRRGLNPPVGLLSSRSFDSSGPSQPLETIHEGLPDVSVLRLPQSEA